MVCFVDMFHAQPERVAGAFTCGFAATVTLTLDARTIYKRRALGERLFSLFSSSYALVVLIGYYLDLFADYRRTQLVYGYLEIHVPSVGMSAWTTLAFLSVKYTISFFTSHDHHPFIILKVGLTLNFLEGGGGGSKEDGKGSVSGEVVAAAAVDG